MSERTGTISVEEYVRGLHSLGGNLEEFLKALKEAGVERVTVDEKVHEIAVEIINSSSLVLGSCKCEVVW